MEKPTTESASNKKRFFGTGPSEGINYEVDLETGEWSRFEA
jgi:hypothetical protein